MENEGFERSLSFLEERGVVVQSLVTDRHTGAQKSMREQRKDIGIVGTGKVLELMKSYKVMGSSIRNIYIYVFFFRYTTARNCS